MKAYQSISYSYSDESSTIKLKNPKPECYGVRKPSQVALKGYKSKVTCTNLLILRTSSSALSKFVHPTRLLKVFARQFLMFLGIHGLSSVHLAGSGHWMSIAKTLSRLWERKRRRWKANEEEMPLWTPSKPPSCHQARYDNVPTPTWKTTEEISKTMAGSDCNLSHSLFSFVLLELKTKEIVHWEQ